MSFELHQRKHIEGDRRGIARRQLRRGTEALKQRDARTVGTGVHEARRCVKKVRAIVKTLRDAGGDVARKDRRRLRKASRQLSALRDSAAIVEISIGCGSATQSAWRSTPSAFSAAPC